MTSSAKPPETGPAEEFTRPWARSDGPVPRLVLRPLERFLRREAGSGALLLGAALVALVWANVAGHSYDDFWSTEGVIALGSLELELDLRHLVNDLLMALFFYVVALEVKREFLHGSLRDRRSAAVPIAAAFGTMAGAAATYVAINLDGGNLRGWAIPIATDIAFALSVLGVVGRRAPRALRAFMLTLAVVDDIGTILVIAVFYSAGVSVAWLCAGVVLVAAVVVMRHLGVRLLVPYLFVAAGVWLALYEAGIHPTIAGVILGFLTPAVAFHERAATGRAIDARLRDVRRHNDNDNELGEGTIWDVSRLAREAVSPLARMEELLHPWSAYIVLPVFALANAGVAVSADDLGDALASQVGLGIILGLVVGAPLGGIAFAWILTKATPSRLPDDLDWPAVAGVAPLKGIGFTVAIFIAVLAFEDDASRDQATLAILIASALAGLIGFGALVTRSVILQRKQRDATP
jgi:NhaA family Na+:H+ antiporter